MASCTKASCVRVRFSKSLVSLRQRPSQPKVRSTIQRLGRITKPLVGPCHDLQVHLANTLYGGSGLDPAVATVGKEALQEYEQASDRLQKGKKAIPVLDIGRGDGEAEHQTQRVDDGVPLLAFHLLGRVVSYRIDVLPPFSTLLTL